MTVPYSAKAAAALTDPIRHECAVTVRPRTGAAFALDADDVSVTFSEDWAPFAQASIRGAIPSTQAKLDALDPRILCRIEIDTGYTYQDGTTELFPLADLGLVDRGVLRPSNVLELSAASDEALTQDYIWRSDFPLMPTNGINEAVSWCLEFSLMQTGYTLSTFFGPGVDEHQLLDLTISIGDPMWRMLDEIATRTGKRVYCGEDGIWRIRNRNEISATPLHSLTVGQDGTILDTATSLSRDNWYNSVLLEHEWMPYGASEPMRRFGHAAVTSGPFAVGTVGYKTYHVRSDRVIAQDTLTAAAVAKLSNLVTRGRSLRLTAIAAYWLRPGNTISVTLPTGEPELYIIQSVTFRPLVGLMDIVTRQPANVTITTGE